ncbi:bcl-2-related ovarian killer protein isoform X1 [Marmota monax]|uniref:bcl-2-related ovarian killer protein isoform X1 n=1 Tax=Marmota monax TaxID=9995 RepID=UPI001EB0761E|nr:bcl-2-related ovarian killer protein isoform X1 [Marmota monax]
MEVLRRSSVFAAEIMDAFDRSPTDKELVAQAKALGREYVHARLLRAGLAWSAPERAAPAPGGRLAEVCAVLLRLGDELEKIRPGVYRNVAGQLHLSMQSEPVVTDAFLAVAGHIFSAVSSGGISYHRRQENKGTLRNHYQQGTHLKDQQRNWVWWAHLEPRSASGRQKQADCEFQASLGSSLRPCSEQSEEDWGWGPVPRAVSCVSVHACEEKDDV